MCWKSHQRSSSCHARDSHWRIAAGRGVTAAQVAGSQLGSRQTGRGHGNRGYAHRGTTPGQSRLGHVGAERPGEGLLDEAGAGPKPYPYWHQQTSALTTNDRGAPSPATALLAGERKAERYPLLSVAIVRCPKALRQRAVRAGHALQRHHTVGAARLSSGAPHHPKAMNGCSRVLWYGTQPTSLTRES